MGNFETSTADMSIRIDNEYKGKGYSKGLIKTLCAYIRKHHYPRIREDQLIFIDMDASEGFWEEIGMTSNKTYVTNRDNAVGKGMEMEITFRKLEKWANSKKGRKKENTNIKEKKEIKTVIFR